MEKKIAKIISTAFHPLIMPTLAICIIMNLNNLYSVLLPFSWKLMFFSLVLISTYIFPIILMLILLKKNLIKSMKMETREERIFPFLMTAIFYYLTFYFVRQIQLPSMYYILFLGSTFLILVILFINFLWKISIHMAGIGGMVGLFTAISINFQIDLHFIISILILVSGLVAFARLKSNSHSPTQVYTGFLVGFLIMFSFYIF